MMIDLIKFTVKDGATPAAIEAMTAQTHANRGEAGCVLSHVFQGKDNPGELYMLLGWADQGAVESHLRTEHDQRFREAMDPLLADPPQFFEWDKII